MRSVHLFMLFGLLLASAGAQAQYVRVEGRGFADADGKPYRIRGTNLGNWFVPEGYMWRLEGAASSPREIEALVETLLGPDKAADFWRDYRDRYVTQADIDFLARVGCNTLRVPLHYKFFLEEHAEGFRLLDRLIEWSRGAGLHLILDLHCAPGGQTGTNIDDSRGYPWLFESEDSQAQLVAVWQDLARHYRDEPVVLGYDLLNEPLPAYPTLGKYKAALEPLLRRVLEAVRAIDPQHIVFFTGANWDSDFSVLGRPPGDNVAYTFHAYWMPPTAASIQPFLDFRQQYNVPIWIGETGENNDEWVGEFRRVLDAHDVGWTFWPYKKMESTAGFVRFARPLHWDRIVAFAKQPQGTNSDTVKANLAVRPSAVQIEAVFADLLRQIEYAQCQPNRGYLDALGLGAPKP